MATENAKKNPATLVAVLSIYSLVSAVLYLWGYWPQFNINILEFIEFQDIIKVAAYPIASSFVFVIIGTLLPTPFSKSLRRIEPDSPFGRHITNNQSKYLFLYYSLLLVFLIMGNIEKWTLLPMFAALPLIIAAQRKNLFDSMIADPFLRTGAIMIVCTLPLLSYGFGRYDAERVLNSSKYQYVAGNIPGIDLPDASKITERTKYLGHAGDYIFLLAPTSSIEIVELEKIQVLELKSYPVMDFSLRSYILKKFDAN